MALLYPSNVMEHISWGATGIVFTFYERANSKSSSPFGEGIIMPVPKDLNNPMDISWEQTSLGSVGNAIAGNESFDWSGAIQTAGLKGLDNLMAMAGADQGKAEAIAGFQLGEIANPYIAMTFKSIGFRKFSMEFRFSPHNVGECQTIDKIVKQFRKVALPTQNGARIGYPGEMMISYLNFRDVWLPKFKRSVIEDVQVSYSGQGHFASMDNGFPAETVLNLKFTENELVWRKDVDLGY